MERFIETLAGVVTAYPKRVVAVTVALVLAATSGAVFLDFSNNYRAFFSAENPELVAFESFQETYTKSDNILFVVRPAEGDVFAALTLAAVEWLTTEAWQIPYALRVDSVTNFQHTSVREDDLFVEDLVRDASSLTPAERAARRDIALREPLLRGSLLSDDARSTGINVTLQYPEESLREVPTKQVPATWQPFLSQEFARVSRPWLKPSPPILRAVPSPRPWTIKTIVERVGPLRSCRAPALWYGQSPFFPG